MEVNKWEVKSHSHQIADTGDYDGWHELTNGVISLGTKDDGDEIVEYMQSIADAFMNADIEFFDAKADDLAIDNHCLKEEVKILGNEWKQKYNDLKARYEQMDAETTKASSYAADAYYRLHNSHEELKGDNVDLENKMSILHEKRKRGAEAYRKLFLEYAALKEKAQNLVDALKACKYVLQVCVPVDDERREKAIEISEQALQDWKKKGGGGRCMKKLMDNIAVVIIFFLIIVLISAFAILIVGILKGYI